MNKKISKAIYKIVYEKILENIEKKVYTCCNKLPSENCFASEFKVNRHTIRKALQLLKDSGLIYTQKGKGNYLANIKVPYSISDKSSYTSKIQALGYEPQTKLLSVDIIKPSSDVAKNLGINKNLNVIEIKLLRYANDLPITVSYSYFDAYRFRKIIDNINIKPFSLYALLKKCYPTLEIIKTSTVFEALNASAELNTLLSLHSFIPIISACTISKDQDGNFVEYGTSYSRADAVKIQVNLV